MSVALVYFNTLFHTQTTISLESEASQPERTFASSVVDVCADSFSVFEHARKSSCKLHPNRYWYDPKQYLFVSCMRHRFVIIVMFDACCTYFFPFFARGHPGPETRVWLSLSRVLYRSSTISKAVSSKIRVKALARSLACVGLSC